MSAFTRGERRLLCNGVQLTRPKDGTDPGKWPVLENVRSTIAGTIQTRPGIEAIPGASFGEPIHTITRFDDATPFATNQALYFVGHGADIESGGLNGPFAVVDTGYSGSPLSWATATPPQSPEPWWYVADTARMRKFDANANVFQIGIQPPLDEPTADLQALGVNLIESFDAGLVPWVPIGTGVTISASVFRVNTLISEVLFDNGGGGNTYASIYPGTMDGINEGMLLTVGGSETVAVTETTIAIATTTVAAIQYDSGTTGLCTIQPVGSLGVGQLEGPSLQDYETRAGVVYARPVGYGVGGTGTDLPPVPTTQGTVDAPRIRQLDFPVNCLVRIGTELVRIQSVALGPDGVQSFRCTTNDPHGVGESLVGAAGFRAFLVTAWGGATTLTDKALPVTMSVVAPVAPATSSQKTGGMRTSAGWVLRNLAQINGRATLPDDDLYFAVRCDNFPVVQTVRVYFSLEPTAGTVPNNTTDFTANYYFFEWRQADIASAIQSVNAATVSSLITARQIAQANAITSGPVLTGAQRPHETTINGIPVTQSGANGNVPFRPATALVSDANSQQLALGNNQWIALHCKVKDLIHVGTEASKTLANVTAAELLIDIASTTAATLTADFDGLWLAGGYEPDVGALGNPYVYCSRYRSSLTGGRSNPSPPLRGGMIPKRQAVSLSGGTSSDPQVDLVDWFRLGGALTAWTYAGTVANGAAFLDTYSDANLSGGETLDYNLLPPFPTQDLPHAGTCDVAGSSVTWRSGDPFDTNWVQGSLIIINGQTSTLYAQPASTSRLFIHENAGSGTGVPFTLPGPTIINQNFGAIWGGPIVGAQFLFGCRNPIDPGMVSWTNGNDTETASDKNTLQVTDGSEPLQAGFMGDGVSFVASTENLYRLIPTFGSTTTFVPEVTPCGRGFWSPWAWCLAPEGVYFVAKDGIFLSAWGGPAVSITDDDLYPLFPHEGIAGQAVNGMQPVALYASMGDAANQVCTTVGGPPPPPPPSPGPPPGPPNADLRLAYVDGWVLFDYSDVTTTRRALAYHVATKAWYPDIYAPGIQMRTSATGQQVHEALMGGVDGVLYRANGATDDGVAIVSHAQYVDNQQDIRRFKLYRDFFLRGTMGGALVTVTLGVNDNGTVLIPSSLTGGSDLANYLVDTVPQTGLFGTNLTVDLQWSPADAAHPILETVDVAYQLSPEGATSWLSGPTTLGSSGFKQIPRALLCYISTGPLTFSVIIDGVLYTYTLPNSFGQYVKEQVVLQSVKGKTFQFGVQTTNPALLFDQDLEIWTQPWGVPGGYQVLRPF